MIFDYVTQPLQRPKVNQSKNAKRQKWVKLSIMYNGRAISRPK